MYSHSGIMNIDNSPVKIRMNKTQYSSFIVITNIDTVSITINLYKYIKSNNDNINIIPLDTVLAVKESFIIPDKIIFNENTSIIISSTGTACYDINLFSV